MSRSKKLIFGFVFALFLASSAWVCVRYYSYLFARTVIGKIERVERVNQNEMIVASGRSIPPSQLFSFAVAIRDEKGEIHTSSSEDRQWSVAQKDQCVEAKFFPYPPWDFDHSGTFHNARLLRLFDCPGGK